MGGSESCLDTGLIKRECSERVSDQSCLVSFLYMVRR